MIFRWAFIQLCLVVVALVNCAGESNAQCMFNPSDCNGKGLCNLATEWRDGVRYWSRQSKWSRHVQKAKLKGLFCQTKDHLEPIKKQKTGSCLS